MKLLLLLALLVEAFLLVQAALTPLPPTADYEFGTYFTEQ